MALCTSVSYKCNEWAGLSSMTLSNTNSPWVKEWENLVEVDNLKEKDGGPKKACGNLQAVAWEELRRQLY